LITNPSLKNHGDVLDLVSIVVDVRVLLEVEVEFVGERSS